MMNYDVVIVGAGFAGLAAAKSFRKSNLKVCLIDKTNHHLFQPLLYQVATAALSPGNIAHPTREIFKKNKNITTLMGEVSEVDLINSKIKLTNQNEISYKHLILSPGSRHHYFNQTEWEKYAPGLKTLTDALQIRNNILSQFEQAEVFQESASQSYPIQFVIIGGGPTGVELAGSIAEIAHESLVKDYRHIDPKTAKIYLIEASDQLLSGYPKHMAQRAKTDLETMHVDVLLNHRVTNINAEEVEVLDLQSSISQTKTIKTNCVLWAAGNKVSPLVRDLGLDSDSQGRVKVEPDLSIKQHPNVFIIGDCAYVENEKNRPIPAIAPAAKQMGEFVANKIKNPPSNVQAKQFKYKDMGMMATIGKYKAVVLSGPLKSSGIIAWFLWGIVHIYFLINFRSRMVVFVEWLFYFFKGQRNQRLILKESDTKKIFR